MKMGLRNPWKLMGERQGFRYYQNQRTGMRIAQKHIDYPTPPGRKDKRWLSTGEWSSDEEFNQTVPENDPPKVI